MDEEEITMDNIQKKIIVSSLRKNSINSLYKLISKVYIPLLRVDE